MAKAFIKIAKSENMPNSRRPETERKSCISLSNSESNAWTEENMKTDWKHLGSLAIILSFVDKSESAMLKNTSPFIEMRACVPFMRLVRFS